MMSKIATTTKKILRGKNQQLGLAWLYLSLIGLVVVGLIDIGAQNGPKNIKIQPKAKQISYSNFKSNKSEVTAGYNLKKSEKNKVNYVEKSQFEDLEKDLVDENMDAPAADNDTKERIINIHHELKWSKDKKEKKKSKNPTIVNNQD